MIRKVRKGKRRVITVCGLPVFSYVREWTEREQRDYLYQKKLERLAKREKGKGVSPDGVVTVSLTSYGRRLEDVYITIESLFQQRSKAKRIILWVGNADRDKVSKSKALSEAVKRGLEIEFCDDKRSYTKLLPFLEKYGFEEVLTVDDDTLYPPFFIERLEGEIERYPGVTLSYRGKHITRDQSGSFVPYLDWPLVDEELAPSLGVYVCGCSGVFYPKDSLDPVVLDYDLARSLCPTTDDFWFKVAAMLKGTKAKVVVDRDGLSALSQPMIEGSQEGHLASINLESENIRQLTQAFDHFDLWSLLD